MAVFTRKESKILKNQRRCNIIRPKEIKISINRVNIPIVKKSYKNPTRNKMIYIPHAKTGFYYLVDKYKQFNFSSASYDAQTKVLRLDRNFFKIHRENEVVYAYICIRYKEGYHANVLVVDKTRKKIHLFEPAMGLFLVNEKKRILEKIAEYFPEYVTSYSETIPLQSDSSNVRYPIERGYCFAWCIWFIEVCIMNKTIDSNIINERLLNMFEDINTLQYMRGYARFYEKTISKLGVKKLPKINQNYLVNLQEVNDKIDLKLKEFFSQTI